MFAAYNGHAEVLEILLDSNANICVEKRLTCLDLAVQNTQPDTAKAILKRPNWKEVGL
jgi:ankyrin repeat protein